MLWQKALALAGLLAGSLEHASAQEFYPPGHFDKVSKFSNLEGFGSVMTSNIPAGKTTFVRFIASEG